MKSGVFLYLIIIIASACNNSQDQAHTIVGLWQLAIIEARDSLSGKWTQANWMKNGTGYLHYDSHGNMSAHFLPEGYNELNEPGNLQDEIGSSDYWYLAEYSIDEQAQTLTHQRYLHSDPSQKDELVKRRYEFHGDTLYLFADEFDFRLKWIKQ